MTVLATRAQFWLYSILLALVALAPNWAAADDDRRVRRPFDQIVVFGDSLSDPGNGFALNGGQTIKAPDYGMTGVGSTGIPEVVTLIPDAPYTSRRASNGRVWIEDLAADFGLAPNARPAVAGALFGEEDGRASNYAVGGATATANLSDFPLGKQVDLFLADVNNHAPSDALYVIAIGGNDVRAALAGVPGALIAGPAAVGQNIQRLYYRGAKKFLVWNAPDLGRTPATTRLDPIVCAPPFRVPAALGCLIAAATGASTAYNVAPNTGLNAVLGRLAGLQGITIVTFDTFGALKKIQYAPEKFGLKDATTACIEPNVPPFSVSTPPFRCHQPDRHFFWDGIHPTRGGHRVIADMVGEVLREAVFDD